MPTLTFDQLRDAVAGEAVALRSRVTLQPAGGPGTKVAPPTYGVADNAEHKYATEKRVRADGSVSETVLLNSVAAQANAMEEALLEGWDLDELDFPVAYVDFETIDDLADLGKITSLEAPHRLADAIFRDSLLDDTLFRLSAMGQAITEATPRNAAAMLRYCPHALLFGMWDSTGPKGGLGSKFQRAIVSEIVGFDAEIGAAVGSRVDPIDVRRGVEGITDTGDDEVWDFTDKGKMRPSEINHGNVTPSIDHRAGGATISEAEMSTVLSLAALRRLRFPVTADGTPIPGGDRRAAETAARTAVAALGVAAIAYQHELDFDLRSRCLLIPTHEPRIELLRRDGSEPTVYEIDREAAQSILAKASEAAEAAGLGFGARSTALTPAPKFEELIRRSRAVAVAETPAAD